MIALIWMMLVPSLALDEEIKNVLPEATQNYQWLHQHPEVSLKEQQTSAYMAKQLKALGLEVIPSVGKTGLMAVLRGGKPGKGPVVLYRADLDALPVLEQTGLAYASVNKGVMHACGHDVHMATALGVLRVLVRERASWTGTVIFVGQPAEELGFGARAMINDPKFNEVLKRTGTPTLSLAMHDEAEFDASMVGMQPGFIQATVDSIDITLYGRGGHGAKPHQTVDPVVMGSELVMSLQTIVSRRLPPGTPAVITVGRFSAGTKHNIIGPSAELQLTVRSYDDDTRAKLLSEITHVTESIATAYHAPEKPKVVLEQNYIQATYNDPVWTEKLRVRLVEVLGEKHVVGYTPSLGGEDFGLFASALKIPGVMIKVGTQAQGTVNGPGLHSDKFSPSMPNTLQTSIKAMLTAVRVGLESP